MTNAKSTLKSILNELIKTSPDDFCTERAKEIMNTITKDMQIKKGLFMKSLRAALLGTLKGPDLISTWILLSRIGQDRVRINRCL